MVRTALPPLWLLASSTRVVQRMCGEEQKCHTVLSVMFLLLANSIVAQERHATCDNRLYRNEEVDPGGLRLVGVKESPLGYYPQVPAATTHEHFFQQLREIWSDDCPRVIAQLGLQPGAGPLRNWTAAALWLRYFNHSGVVLAVDAVSDYLLHFEEGLRGEHSVLVEDGGPVRAVTVRAILVATSHGAKAKERPVSFDTLGGGKVLAADEVMRLCSGGTVGPDAEDIRHPCSRILLRMAQAELLEYTAPAVSFDEIWRRHLDSRHVDFLHVDLDSAGMDEMFRKGFAEIFAAREVSILAFRVNALWSKLELRSAVEWLEKFEYLSLFRLVCSNSSQAEVFSYHGPGGAGTGPTTYLPINGIDFDTVVDWDRITLPQDVLALDLRQPDLFKAIQLGDVQCDVDETVAGTCSKDGPGDCSADVNPPEMPQELQVVRSEPRSLSVEWRPSRDGPRPTTYALRLDPGGREDTLEHDIFDSLAGVQMHRINSLRPDTEYTISVRAVGAGGASAPTTLVHRTEHEEQLATVSPYDIAQGLHCGMSPSEEAQPAGPPPSGVSFFRDVSDVDSCRARCDDSWQCVTFQVKLGDACWLYRVRPRQVRLAGPRTDHGWTCGVKSFEL